MPCEAVFAGASYTHGAFNPLLGGWDLTLTRFSEKGLPLTTASCAFRTLAAATSFMASVIFCVFFTDPMRDFNSFRPALCTCQCLDCPSSCSAKQMQCVQSCNPLRQGLCCMQRCLHCVHLKCSERRKSAPADCHAVHSERLAEVQ